MLGGLYGLISRLSVKNWHEPTDCPFVFLRRGVLRMHNGSQRECRVITMFEQEHDHLGAMSPMYGGLSLRPNHRDPTALSMRVLPFEALSTTSNDPKSLKES
jgi:hypothetical protein